MNALLSQSCSFAHAVIHAFYINRDVDKVIRYFAKDVSWIGPSKNDFFTNPANIIDYFLNDRDYIPHCRLSDESLSIAAMEEYSCIVMGSYTVYVEEPQSLPLKLHQRITCYMIIENEELKIKHLHLSNSYVEINNTSCFPPLSTATDYDLQKALAEKIEVLDMITKNINGGLKGSNDDETFSYFYINEGLPKMLGYTYDEFLNMSCGSAVGAVYPPDLPQALADVAKCFAEGPVYSTEYRIRRKDGNLTWFLDSGRKVYNNDGKVKINSILMDITELKDILLALNVERERYRIALENITDVMFEYDIHDDLLTTYQRVVIDGQIELETQTFPDYSQQLASGDIIHLDDVSKLLEVYRGNLSGNIEVRSKIPASKDGWYWLYLQCSVIYDSDHLPIKTIGTFKDITEEKKNVQKLIDQTQRDPLTGLFNPLTAQWHIEEHLLKNPPLPAALLVIDVDNFKGVNDTLGHLTGNDVLIQIATILKGSVAPADLVARIGGDEFLIFIKNTQNTYIQLHATEILAAIKEIYITQDLKISCSIGISITSPERNTYKSLFSSADHALYEAKRQGKGRFVIV